MSPAWIGVLFAIVSAVVGYVIQQDRRITRLEDRVASLGRQLTTLPKRRTDRSDG